MHACTQVKYPFLVPLVLADHRRGLAGRHGGDAAGLPIKERTLVPAPGQVVLRGVEAVSELPAAHYPPHEGVVDRDELANQPQTLN